MLRPLWALVIVSFIASTLAHQDNKNRLFFQKAGSNFDSATESAQSATPYTETPTSASSTSTSCPSSSYLYSCPAGFKYPGSCTNREATLAGAKCNIQGSAELSDSWAIVYNGMLQDRIEDCAFLCHMLSHCNSYGYNSSDLDTPCRFSEKSLANAGLVENTDSSTSWYDLDCANCIRCGTRTPSVVPGLPPDGPSCTQKKNANPQYYCHQRGSVSAGARFYQEEIYPYNASAEACATICSNHDGCKASAHDPSQGWNVCFFSGYSLKDANFQNSAGTQIWSDKACWDCQE